MAESRSQSGELRVGFVGCGRVASLLEDDPLRGKPCTHAGAFSKLPECILTSACDIDNERLVLFGDRWNIPKKHRYTDYISLLDNEELDILVISTWTDSHAGITIAASKCGVKGILCEKPIATNLNDAKKMIDTAQKNNTILIINHERRWDDNLISVKKMLEDNEIGAIRSVYANVLSSAPPSDWHGDILKSGGGPLLHDGTHLMDMLRFFLGDAEWINGYIHPEELRNSIEDSAHALIYFPDKDVCAFVEGGGRRHYFNFEIDIHGTEGRITVGNEYWKKYEARSSKRYEGFRELEPVKFPQVSGKNVWISIAQNLVNSVKNIERPLSDSRDGYKAMELVFAVYQSAMKEGARVFLPLQTDKHPLSRKFHEFSGR